MVDINNNKAIPTTIMGIDNVELANLVLSGNDITTRNRSGYTDSNQAIARDRKNLDEGVAAALNQLATANQTKAYNDAIIGGMQDDTKLLQEQMALLREQNALYSKQQNSASTMVGTILSFNPDEKIARSGDKLLAMNVAEQEALKAKYDRVDAARKINQELSANRANTAAGLNPAMLSNAKVISDMVKDQREAFTDNITYNNKGKQLVDIYKAEQGVKGKVDAAKITADSRLQVAQINAKAKIEAAQITNRGAQAVADVERIKAGTRAGELQALNTINGGAYAPVEGDNSVNELLQQANDAYASGDIKSAEAYYKAFNAETDNRRKRAEQGMTGDEKALFSQRLYKGGKLDSTDKSIASSALPSMGNVAIPSTDLSMPEGEVAAAAQPMFIEAFQAKLSELAPKQAEMFGIKKGMSSAEIMAMFNTSGNASLVSDLKKYINIEDIYNNSVREARIQTGYDEKLHKDFGSYVLGEAYVNPAVPQPVKQLYNNFRNVPKPKNEEGMKVYEKLVAQINQDISGNGEMEAFVKRLRSNPHISDVDKGTFLQFIKQPQFSNQYASTLSNRWASLSNKSSTVLPFIEPETWASRFATEQSTW